MTVSLLGCVADDYTGATDLSSMLVRAGLRVIQCFGVPLEDLDVSEADAIVVSLKSRSIAAAEAVAMSLAALAYLQKVGAERIFFKYCSTFDSTAQGNIGPVADALADALDAHEVLFCPAFPENGRTVYCGHLFVDGKLLNESGMRQHPLNPMTDSSLVRILQSQTKRKVGRLLLSGAKDFPVETAEMAFDGRASHHLIADAIADEDLHRVAELAKEHRLLTGGSAIAQYWAQSLNVGKSKGRPADTPAPIESPGCVVLAGSCSVATRQQVAEFERAYPVLHIDLASIDSSETAIAQALQWCELQWASSDRSVPLLISSSATPSAVEAAREKYGGQAAATLAETVLAGLAKSLQQRGIVRLIVAGGETSGAVINALGIQSVRIGREIAPGVPWVTSTHEPYLSLALKSGNFGGPRFFLDALEMAS